MAIFREIYFGDNGVLIGKGAHALNYIETDLRDSLCS
jgi:hypothetical protein